MNLLGLIFSLLLILSYGFYACWDKQTASHRLRKTYLGHEKANRTLLNRYQSELYKGLGQNQNPQTKTSASSQETKKDPLPHPSIDPNRECAKINLWPLIQEGREAHPALYELTLNLLRLFYEPLFPAKKNRESYFLNALLTSAKSFSSTNAPIALEKIDLENPSLQKLYYKMLKGTKTWNLQKQTGFPPLLEYIKAAPSKDKICLLHAHPDLLASLFGNEAAWSLYEEVHREHGSPFSEELVTKVCAENHQLRPDPEKLSLLEFGRPSHGELKKTLLAEDKQSQVVLRKSVSTKG